MQIIDYVIIGIAVLFLLIGLFRGLIKMTFGLLSGLVALVVAIMLCTTVAGAVVAGTTWDDSLATQLQKSISVGGTETIVYDTSNPAEDVLGYYATNPDTGVREFHKIEDMFGSNVILKVLGGPIKAGIVGSYTKEMSINHPQTLSNLISAWTAVLIIQAISFVVLWIGLAIVLKIISILLKKFVTNFKVGNFLDKILGAVMGVAIAWVLVMVVFTVFGIMQDMAFMAPVMAQIKNSTIAKLLFDNNFIYKLLSSKIDFSAILGTLNSLTGAVGAK